MYPVSYWVVIALLVVGAIWSIPRIKDGTGIPMLAVLGTVTAWYVCDAFYNDYAHSYAIIFDPDVLDDAWWEVAWFLVVFLVAVPYVHQWFNAKHLRYQSGIYQLMKFGVNQPVLQRQLDILFGGCLVVYALIALLATARLGSQVPYFFFPFLGYNAEPWGRGRIGSGFDALLSVVFNVQMLVTAIFGVLAAVASNPRTRILSVALCFVSWPYYIFDRTRNTILAVIVPAILTWVFLRLRGGLWKKVLVLGACFVVVNAWMAFIIENRSTSSIAATFREQGFNIKKESEVHHQGLNMFEELGWINTFIEKGTYEPNWGARYFAELVNPIPRAIWHGKPLIGIDYAIARGQGSRGSGGGGGTANQGSVYATISTGLIGQGIVNFGRFLGPAAAALIMSFWVAVLARQDLHIMKLGRLPLYALGLILTFNLGRDITLITLYPFVFFAAGLWLFERHKRQSNPESGQPEPQIAAHPAQQPRRRNASRSVGMPGRQRRMVTRARPPGGPGISPR